MISPIVANPAEASLPVIRIVIAEDQALVRRGAAMLLSMEPDMEVVGQACNGVEAVELAQLLNPDVVLMDYSMPKLNGVTACRNILAKDPAARVILVSAWSPSEEMMRVGALAILAKPVHLERLEAALKSAATASTVDRTAAASVP